MLEHYLNKTINLQLKPEEIVLKKPGNLIKLFWSNTKIDISKIPHAEYILIEDTFYLPEVEWDDLKNTTVIYKDKLEYAYNWKDVINLIKKHNSLHLELNYTYSICHIPNQEVSPSLRPSYKKVVDHVSLNKTWYLADFGSDDISKLNPKFIYFTSENVSKLFNINRNSLSLIPSILVPPSQYLNDNVNSKFRLFRYKEIKSFISKKKNKSSFPLERDIKVNFISMNVPIVGDLILNKRLQINSFK
jgi:hypothetical protein